MDRRERDEQVYREQLAQEFLTSARNGICAKCGQSKRVMEIGIMDADSDYERDGPHCLDCLW